MIKKLAAIIVAIVLTTVIFSAGCTSNVVNNASPSPSATSSPSASPQPTRDPNFVPKNTPGYLTYGNRSAGFTIQYPPSWRVADSKDLVFFTLFVNTGTASGTVGTVVVWKPLNFSGTGFTLSDYAKTGLNSSTSTLPDYKLLSSSNSTLSGYPSLKYSYTYTTTKNYEPAQGIYEATMANGTGYAVSYAAIQTYYFANLETAQNMIRSFNIVSWETATPTATPDDIAAMESYLGTMGYTVVDHFKYNSTESESHGVYLKPTYDGNLSKGGLRMHTTSIKAENNSEAMNLFRLYVNATRDAAFSRSCVEISSGYKNTTYWHYNCTILQTKYTTVILATGDNWVVSIGPYRTN